MDMQETDGAAASAFAPVAADEVPAAAEAPVSPADVQQTSPAGIQVRNVQCEHAFRMPSSLPGCHEKLLAV